MLARNFAHHPTPPFFLFNNLQIPPSQPSICIPFIFIKIQIPFCANSLVSHRSKTPEVTTHRSILSHPSRVPITNHKSCLFKKLPPLWPLFAAFSPLVPFIFSSLQTLFCRHRGCHPHRAAYAPLLQNTGVGLSPALSLRPLRELSVSALSFPLDPSVSQVGFCLEE
jgi:hypothetical protein